MRQIIWKNKIDIYSIKENHREFIKNDNPILQIQQRFKSKRHNLFTVEINKIAFSSKDDKRMQSGDSIEPYAYGRSTNDTI